MRTPIQICQKSIYVNTERRKRFYVKITKTRTLSQRHKKIKMDCNKETLLDYADLVIEHPYLKWNLQYGNDGPKWTQIKKHNWEGHNLGEVRLPEYMPNEKREYTVMISYKQEWIMLGTKDDEEDAEYIYDYLYAESMKTRNQEPPLTANGKGMTYKKLISELYDKGIADIPHYEYVAELKDFKKDVIPYNMQIRLDVITKWFQMKVKNEKERSISETQERVGQMDIQTGMRTDN